MARAADYPLDRVPQTEDNEMSVPWTLPFFQLFSMLPLTLLTLSLTSRAFRMPVGAPCNITNSHLDANTKAFVSDCDFWNCPFRSDP